MSKYTRSRVKDFFVVAVWVAALIPILPVAAIVWAYRFIEGFAEWYDSIVLSAVRNWRDRWNPEK